MRKLRLTEVTKTGQSHVASEWQRQIVPPTVADPKLRVGRLARTAKNEQWLVKWSQGEEAGGMRSSPDPRVGGLRSNPASVTSWGYCTDVKSYACKNAYDSAWHAADTPSVECSLLLSPLLHTRRCVRGPGVRDYR